MGIQFSVIIPAYNAEKTISRCLNSLLKSKKRNFEILIIDDGSVDDTESICKGIIASDDRVRYYKKENGGVSSARNIGLKYAVGEYICFVDSDDFVEQDYFELISSMVYENCDLLMYGRKTYDGQIYKSERYRPCLITDQDEMVSFLCSELRKQKLNFVCDKVFRRDLINEYDISFPEQLHIGEDKVFVIHYITAIHNVRYMDDLLYVSSTENKNSLSRKIREDLCESVILEHKLMIDAIENADLPVVHRDLYLSALEFSFYRSAYTVIGETEKMSLTKSEKEMLNRFICREFKIYGKKYQSDIKSWCIALPIKLEMITLIAFFVKCRNWKEKV